MTTRTLLRMLSIFACAALAVAPAIAGDHDGLGGGNNGNGVCTLDGAWLGQSPMWGVSWVVDYDSDTHWTGSFTMDFIGGDPTLMGLYPTAVGYSMIAGSWMRTGPRTFDYTFIAYGVDMFGLPVYITKNTGNSAISGRCDHLDVMNMFIAVYDPAQDPFGEDPPVQCIPDFPGSEHFARRIPVDPPCEPMAPPPTPTPPEPTPTPPPP